MGKSTIARILFVILAATLTLRMNLYLQDIGYGGTVVILVPIVMWASFLYVLNKEFPRGKILP